MSEYLKRITFKRARPNPLFEEWLEELYNEAKEKNSKLQIMLKEALNSLSKYPVPLESGTDCAILKGFGKKLCLFLDQRLEVYNYNSLSDTEYSTDLPQSCSPDVFNNEQISEGSNTSTIDYPLLEQNSVEKVNNTTKKVKSKIYSHPYKSGLSSHHTPYKETIPEGSNCSTIDYPINTQNSVELNNSNTSKKVKSNSKTYSPAYKSGGYAVLIALIKHLKCDPIKESLTKDQLIEKAQPYCEESFTKPKPDSYYTAWSSITRLITKGLVIKTKSKKAEFYLSDQGILLAHELLDKYDAMPTTNDKINEEIVALSQSKSFNDGEDIFNNIKDNSPASNSNDLGEILYFPAGSYDIILLIDKQEISGASKKNDPTVAQFKKYPDLKHEYRHLKVGDFTWIARHNLLKDQELVLPYIVERKRMDDLGASIKDGRFHEQKFRLKKCGIPNILYLVEQYGSNKHVGLPIQSLMQAIANTRVQDGFKIIMTDSLNASVRFLAMMSKRLSFEYQNKSVKGGCQDPTNNELMTFTYFNISSSKTKTLTVTETFIKILLQLKGLSVEKALAITNVYKTPRSLIEAYRKCDKKNGELLLANLKNEELSRNVGPSISKSLYKLFTTNNLM